MDKFDHEIDIIIELNRLEALYYHYRNLYRKLFLFCCSNQKQVAKTNRDFYKDKIKIQREKLKQLKEPNY